MKKVKKVKEFVIDRAIWLQGEDEYSSVLHRSPDHKMCCLGIYLNKCGVDKDELLERKTPKDLNIINSINVPAWMMNTDGNHHSDEAIFLMKKNDSITITSKERERLIKEGFAAVGIKVSFKGKYT